MPRRAWCSMVLTGRGLHPHPEALCRLPPVREEHEPPREEHTALRVLLPRVPFPVSHQLGERAGPA